MNRTLTLVRRRLLTALPVLLIVVCATFLLLEAAPGDAVDAYILSSGGGDAELIAKLRVEWGLDQSAVSRLGVYVWSLLHGDLGWSVLFGRPISSVILERLPTTLLLMTGAIALSFFLGTSLGIVAGARPGSIQDRLLSIGSLILYAIPGFWLGLVLAIIFAVHLRWLPSAGIESIASGKHGMARVLDIARHLVLPVVSLGMIYLALYIRMMRTGMAEAWRQDFVRGLRARGLPRAIIVRRIVRNALLPLVTMLGVQCAAMLGGSVVIESVFAVPGFGRLAHEAVSARDTPLLLGVILSSAVLVILVNLVVDAVYAWLDPRIGSTGASA